MMLADQILSFYKSLDLAVRLPKGIQVMNPFQSDDIFALVEKFYNRFYNDAIPRKMIMGINPGRLGGGTTGIPFTDPLKLEKYCNIQNDLPKKAELSADFIYTMIEAYGGPPLFYKHYFVSAVCPLGFTQNGINLNYYDDKELEKKVRGFIVDSINAQLKFNIDTRICFCLGEGHNFKYLRKLNEEHSFFKKIIPLPHPRFIMQYKRKKVPEYVKLYIQQLKQEG